MEILNEMELGKSTVENVGRMKLGKRENPEKNLKNPNFVHLTHWRLPDSISEPQQEQKFDLPTHTEGLSVLSI